MRGKSVFFVCRMVRAQRERMSQNAGENEISKKMREISALKKKAGNARHPKIEKNANRISRRRERRDDAKPLRGVPTLYEQKCKMREGCPKNENVAPGRLRKTTVSLETSDSFRPSPHETTRK